MKKYQIFEVNLRAGENADITIDRTIDRGYNKLKAIYMYTDTQNSKNTNLVVKSPLQIDDREVLPREFDTHLLFPILQNQEFTRLSKPIEIDNSKVECRLESVGAVAEACTLKIVLELEEE